MSKARFELNGLATAIGSMPHVDPQEACSLVLSHLPEIPAWPQLPNRSFTENMYAQFSEGFPGVVLEKERIWIDRSQDLSKPLEQLYSAYLENTIDSGTLSYDYAAGFHVFLNRVGKSNERAVKGQVTGPISFGLTVTDQDRRPLLYDDVLADALAKHIRLKATWQEQALSNVFPNTIIFIDEPYLSSFGSAFVSVSREQVVTLLEEVLGGINGLKGIHCCGNTDWSVVLQTSLDILSLDAYNYGETLSLYPSEVGDFLNRGGVIAWGIIPNDEQFLTKETAASLLERLEETMGLLSKKGIDYDILTSRCLITPSCSLASVSTEAAARALEMTAGVSSAFRKKLNKQNS
ncbi:MAG TPA: methionine synthase [Dehalococcoidia bacterium]|nr:methionine synthase [Dehalococcoidia bacterium]